MFVFTTPTEVFLSRATCTRVPSMVAKIKSGFGKQVAVLVKTMMITSVLSKVDLMHLYSTYITHLLEQGRS